MHNKLFFISLMTMCLAGSTAYAQNAASWQLEPGRIIGGSSAESGARLMDPVILDFNQDGIDDLIFGAPGTSPNETSGAGSVYVILGKKNLDLRGKIDTTQWTSFDYRFDGHTPNGRLGIQLYSGDFNGDGSKDLAIAEPGGMGTLYILYSGKQRTPGTYDIAQKGAADVSFGMTEQGSSLGLSGCIGDFNRDGIDDIAMASLSHNATLGTNLSLVTILAMRREWDKSAYDLGSKIYGKTVISRPVASTTRVLHNCTVGDFNDDNVPDIALGMPLDSYQKQRAAGSVTIIYHPYKYNGTTIDIASIDEKYGIRISGNQANAQFGYALAAGDFTGDGKDDLAISAPNRLIKGPDSEGAVYVYDSNHMPAHSGEQPDTYQINGKGGQFGYRLYNSDTNGDRRPDLVIAAPFAGVGQAGSLSAYLGGPFFVENLENKKNPDIELRGAEHMSFGVGVAFGDLNGDGKVDLAARSAEDPAHRPMTGAYEIVGDFQSLPASSELTDNFLTVLGPSKGGGLQMSSRKIHYQGKNYLGWLSPQGMGNRSVICLVESTRTLVSDISVTASESCDVQIVGPENATIIDFSVTDSATLKPLLTIAVSGMPANHQKAQGFVAVIPLPDAITQPLVLNLTENTLKTDAVTFVLSDEPAAMLGQKIEWLDLDKDGYLDLIIGAPKRVIDNDVSGSIFIVKGNTELQMGFHELTAKDVIQYEGFSNEEFGSQWQVLDFNKDGQLDLLARAAHTPDAFGDEYATVYAIYGAGHRLPKTYSVRSPELGSMRIIAPQARAGLEIIQQNVDLNEDGYDDLVLFSPDYRAGLQKKGILYVVPTNDNHKSGDLLLTQESHIAFSYTSTRNEKITDARFIRNNGKLVFIVASADLSTGTASSLSAFVDEDGIFKGDYTSANLKRVLSEAKLPKPVKFLLMQDEQKKQDEIWMLFPSDGVTQSGQGIAQKVKPW